MRNFKIVKSHDKYKLMHEPNIILRKERDKKKRARIKNDAWNPLSRHKFFEKTDQQKGSKIKSKKKKKNKNRQIFRVLAI